MVKFRIALTVSILFLPLVAMIILMGPRPLLAQGGTIPFPCVKPGLDFGNFEQPLTGLFPSFEKNINAFITSSGNKPIIRYMNYIAALVTGGIVAISVIIIVIAGYRYIVGEDPKPAKTMMNAALLGIVLALGAYSLLAVISNQFVNPASDPTVNIATSSAIPCVNLPLPGIEPIPGVVGCSNFADDDGDGRVDAADPGCHDDGNASNPASYDPNDNDERDSTPPPPRKPQCSDGANNNDADNLIDTADPGCYSDLNIFGTTYDPTDNDESNPWQFQCADGITNDNDVLVDIQDPDCHIDGDATNQGSWDKLRNEVTP